MHNVTREWIPRTENKAFSLTLHVLVLPSLSSPSLGSFVHFRKIKPTQTAHTRHTHSQPEIAVSTERKRNFSKARSFVETIVFPSWIAKLSEHSFNLCVVCSLYFPCAFFSLLFMYMCAYTRGTRTYAFDFPRIGVSLKNFMCTHE